jgi:hypothetical protein
VEEVWRLAIKVFLKPESGGNGHIMVTSIESSGRALSLESGPFRSDEMS